MQENKIQAAQVFQAVIEDNQNLWQTYGRGLWVYWNPDRRFPLLPKSAANTHTGATPEGKES